MTCFVLASHIQQVFLTGCLIQRLKRLSTETGSKQVHPVSLVNKGYCFLRYDALVVSQVGTDVPEEPPTSIVSSTLKVEAEGSS